MSTINGDEWYCIKDENGQYVHKHSIKYCEKQWYYSSRTEPERGYISYERALDSLHNLELQNRLAKFEHSFQVIKKII